MLEIVPAGVIVFPGSGITAISPTRPSVSASVLDHREGGALELVLGAWLQIFHIKCDVQPRERIVVVTVLEE